MHIMDQLPPLQLENLSQIFLDSYMDCLEEDLQREKRFLQACDDLYRSYMSRIRRVESKNDRSKYINETDWLKTSLYKLLEEEFPEKREIPFEEEFEKFINSADGFLMETPSNVRLEQLKERFLQQESDSFTLSAGKFLKRNAFHLSKLPLRFANLFRKEKKEIHYWSHRIPLKSMIESFFINRLVEENLYAFEELMKAKCKHLNLNWKIIQQINRVVSEFLNTEEQSPLEFIKSLEELEKGESLRQSQEDLDSAMKDWREKGASSFSKIQSSFKDAILKVDTIELGRSHFSIAELRSGRQEYLSSYRRIFGGWKNSLFAQLDDIQIDIELYHIKYFALMQYFLLKNSSQNRIENTINNHFKPIEKHFDDLIERLRSEKPDQLAKLITSEKEELINQLQNKIIPQTVEAIYDQDFPNLLDRMEFKLGKAVGKMKDERIIYANNKYDVPIRKSELSQFNPRELVQISILKSFSEDIGKLKASVIEQLEVLQSELNELSGIIDYNLESALNSADEEDGESEEIIDIKEVACEGITRTKAKTTSIQDNLLKLQETIDKQLKLSVEKMSVELVKLTVNENITELRLKLATAKAVNRTTSIKDKALDYVHYFTPKVVATVSKVYKKIQAKVQEYLENLGFRTTKPELTAELSDFLLKTEEATSKLPYVYKRLFRIKPLSEEIFFEGRQKELDQLYNAHTRWEVGNYEATVITGEKGSGTSSLMNFFIEKIGRPSFIRYKLSEAYSSHSEFIQLFQEILKTKEVKSQDDLVNHLLAGEKKVVIIEDAQHLYLKKIGGFEAMQLLFDLISETAHHIFWVIEVTTYTYEFLQKTIQISSYFKNRICLLSLGDEMIVNLIMKRHRVSGYNLEFILMNPDARELRKMRRFNPEERQEYLKAKYFKKLNEFAKSNISLALLYWLRSTQDVNSNTIQIGMMGDLKFEFLAAMQDESIFTLHALLLHDSLNVKEHAVLFHQSEWQSKMNLMVLEDNGILKIVNERYHINRLLYRQVVNVLRQKNIIH